MRWAATRRTAAARRFSQPDKVGEDLRNFTASFLSAAKGKFAAPYLVLEVDWIINGQTTPTYYIDRPATAFTNNDGQRLPPSSVDPAVMVLQWPSVSLS